MNEQQNKRKRRRLLPLVLTACLILAVVGVSAAVFSLGAQPVDKGLNSTQQIKDEAVPLSNFPQNTAPQDDDVSEESESSAESVTPPLQASYANGNTDSAENTSNDTGAGNEATTPVVTTYTLTYSANGGTNVPTDLNVYPAGTQVPVAEAQDMTYRGYVFAGWNTVPEGTGQAYVAGSTLHLQNDVTLYAQWTPATLVTSVPVAYGAERSFTVYVENASDAWWEALDTSKIQVTSNGNRWTTSSMTKDSANNSFTLHTTTSSNLDRWTTYTLTIASVAPYEAQVASFKPVVKVPVAVTTLWQTSGELVVGETQMVDYTYYLNMVSILVNGRTLGSSEYTLYRTAQNPHPSFAGRYYVIIKASVFSEPGSYTVALVSSSSSGYETLVFTVTKPMGRMAPFAESPDETSADIHQADTKDTSDENEGASIQGTREPQEGEEALAENSPADADPPADNTAFEEVPEEDLPVDSPCTSAEALLPASRETLLP